MGNGIMPYAYLGGKVVPREEAKVNLASNSLQYGTSCFGGMRGYYREGKIRLFRTPDHYERLINSTKMLGFGLTFSYDDFFSIVRDLLKANKPTTDVYIRAFIFSDDERVAPKLPGLNFQLAVYLVPLGDYYDPSKGLKLMISSWRKIPDDVILTKAKASGCYLNSALATTEALRNGYDEALVTDINGYIVEGSVANLIIIYRDQPILPPVGAPLLEGITMRTCVTLLEEMGYEPRFQRVDRSMVYSCQELMLTGTAAQVIHGHSVDGRVIGDGSRGPIATKLCEIYRDITEKRHPRSDDWIQEITV